MSLRDDARYSDINDPHFKPQGKRVCWRRGDGTLAWSRLYTPSDYAKRWDNAEWANTSIGMPCLHGTAGGGCWFYASMKVTGRGPVKIPLSGEYGTVARVTTNVGTEDDRQWKCWVL
jgi:hypothetical protein